MKQGLTDLTILLDRSGSMEVIKEDTIGGIRTLVEDQKKVPGECRLTFVQFDKPEDDFSYEELYREAQLADIKKLEIHPRGWTPLLDAVGRMIIETGKRLGDKPEEERPEHVVIIIATDGQENSSKEYTRDQIKEMIKHQTEVYNWQFTYIGANQNAFDEARGMGINVKNALSYAANSIGTQMAYCSASAAVANLRVGKSSSVCYNDADYEKQHKAGAKHWKATTTVTHTTT